MGDAMSKEEKDLLETFRELTPENRDNMLAYVRVARSAQENTLRAMENAEKEKEPA
jgi:hypothetical protein